jgi:phage-related protein
VSDTAGQLFVRITPDTKKFGSELDKQMGPVADKAAGSFKDSFVKKWGSFSIGGLLAGGGLVAGIGSAISSASDLNETMTKTQAVFGENTAEITKFADEAATKLGQSKQAALDAAAGFGIFGQLGGLKGGDLASFSSELTTLTSDLASFYNTTPEDAATAVGAALRGESEPIRRFGVLLDDATLKAAAMREGLIDDAANAPKVAKAKLAIEEAQRKVNDATAKFGPESLEARKATADLEAKQAALQEATSKVSGTLTPQQKVLAAHSEIMRQTSLAQGDFSKTSDGLANQQRIMKAQLENTKSAIGAGLLPTMQSALGVINGLVGAFTSLSPSTQAMIGKIIGLAAGAAVFARAGAFVVANVLKLSSAIGTVGKAIGGLTKIMAANPWILLILATIALVVIIVKNWDTIKEYVGKALEFLGKVVGATWGAIKDATSAAWDFITKITKAAWDGIKAAIGAVVDALEFLFKNFTLPGLIIHHWETIKKVTQAAWDGIKDAIMAVWDAITGAVSTAVEAVKNVITGAWDAIKTAAQETWDFFKGIITGAWDFIREFFRREVEGWKNIIGGVWTWISDTATAAWEGFKGIITGAWDFIRDFFQREVEGWKNILTGVWDWIKNAATEAWEAFKGIITGAWDFVRDFIQREIDGWKNILGGAWTWIKDTAQEAWDKVTELISGAVGKVVDYITGIPDKIKNAFTGLADMITGPFISAFNAIADAWNNTVGKLHFKTPSLFGVGGFEVDIPDIPKLNRRAMGGPVRAGQSYLVGERGMELFQPGRSGTVFPAQKLDQLANANGNGNISVVVNVSQLVVREQADVDRIAQSLATQTQQRLKAKGQVTFPNA